MHALLHFCRLLSQTSSARCEDQPMGVRKHPRLVTVGRRRYTTIPLHIVYLLAGIIGGVCFVSFCKNTFLHCGITQARGLCCFVSLDRRVYQRETSKPLAPFTQQNDDPHEHIHSILKKIRESHNDSGRNDKFVLIGVMTARRYIQTRVAAAQRTWVPSIPGKVIYFSSEGTPPYANFPIIPLIGVDDSYPPQRKSFSMLKFMQKHFADEYEWFMRVDDDIYIRGAELGLFLRSVNSSRPQFIGQSGTGTKEELGLLSLNEDENYCMGGPGVVFSRKTLRKVAMNADSCLKKVESTHEDVEVGRCVRRHADIPCTWAYEMTNLFFHNYLEEKGSFTHELRENDITNALTLHPIKKAPYLFRIHNYINSLTALEKNQNRVALLREINAMNGALGMQSHYADSFMKNLGVRPSFGKFVPRHRDVVLIWKHVMKKHALYSHLFNNPHPPVSRELMTSLHSIRQRIVKMLNDKTRHSRMIHYSRVEYAYYRINPQHGIDFVLDMSLIYHKHKGRKVTLPLRMPLHQTFMEPHVLITGLDSSPATFLSAVHTTLGQNDRIHFIVPLSGRHNTFVRFMANFENVCLKSSANVELRIILYKTIDEEYKNSLNLAIEYQTKYPSKAIKIIQTNGTFSRGASIQLGMSALHISSLMFFIDIDMQFNSDVLIRIHRNTVKGHVAYFPIVFSQYDPHTVPACSQHATCKPDTFSFGNNLGFWRRYGYGIASLYKSDFKRVGGFNKTIQQWGLEDVDLYEKIVASNMTVMRSCDTGLVHMYHAVNCDSLQQNYRMCLASHASSYAPQMYLSGLIGNASHRWQEYKKKKKV